MVSVPSPTKKSFIINEGLRIRDQHEIALDFVTLDQPINQLAGDLKTFKYSMIFAAGMMVMGKFLFSIHVPKIIEVLAVGLFSVAIVYGLFMVLQSFNKAVKQYAFSTMALYTLLGLLTFMIVGLF